MTYRCNCRTRESKTNVAALELTRHLGVCYRTAWRLKHKLMQAMCEREASRKELLSKVVFDPLSQAAT